MTDRVDQELRRVTTALAEVSPPKPENVERPSPRRRPPVLAAAVSFVVVLGFGVVVGLGLGEDPDRGPAVATTVPAGSTMAVAPTGPVPEDHLVAELLAEGATFEEFGRVSWSCSNGGSAFGPFTLCLVDDEGLLVVVPLRMPAGMEAVVSGSAFNGEVAFDLPGVSSERVLPALEDLVAISHREGTVELELRFNGEPAGASVSGILESGGEQSPTGIVPVPERHIANEVLALATTRSEIQDLAIEMGFESLCGSGGGLSKCVIWEDGVAVIVPFSVREGASIRVRSASEDWVEIPVEEGVPVGVGHDAGLFIVQYLIDGEHYSSASTCFPSSASRTCDF